MECLPLLLAGMATSMPCAQAARCGVRVRPRAAAQRASTYWRQRPAGARLELIAAQPGVCQPASLPAEECCSEAAAALLSSLQQPQ